MRRLLIGTLLLVAACSGSSHSASVPAPTSVAPSTASPSACTAVSGALIKTFLPDGSKLTVTHPMSIKAPARNDVYLVGGIINGQVAIWTRAGGVEPGSGLTASVSPEAQAVTDWPKSTIPVMHMTMGEPGVTELEMCVRA